MSFNYKSEFDIFMSFKCRITKVNLMMIHLKFKFMIPEAEIKEFKYGWFHLKLYSIFQDLSRRSIETGFWGI